MLLEILYKRYLSKQDGSFYPHCHISNHIETMLYLPSLWWFLEDSEAYQKMIFE